MNWRLLRSRGSSPGKGRLGACAGQGTRPGRLFLAGFGGSSDHRVLHRHHFVSSSQQSCKGDIIIPVAQMRKLRPREVECLTRSLSRAGMRFQVSLTSKPRSSPLAHTASCLPYPSRIRASLSLGPSLGRECWELLLATELDSEGVPSASSALEMSPETFVLGFLEWGGASFSPRLLPLYRHQGRILSLKGGHPSLPAWPRRSLMNWLCAPPTPFLPLQPPPGWGGAKGAISQPVS